MKKEDIIKEIHNLIFEFIPLYHEKFGIVLRTSDRQEPKCNKNQKRAIFFLKRAGKITPTELGKRLDLRRGSLTTLIDSLVEMNLVVREPDPEDRRQILLSLTDKGEEYIEKKIQAYEKHLMNLFSSKTEDEVRDFLKSIKYVVEFMRRL